MTPTNDINTRDFLRRFQLAYKIGEYGREMIRGYIARVALEWFVKGGGAPDDFEKLYNNNEKQKQS